MSARTELAIHLRSLKLPEIAAAVENAEGDYPQQIAAAIRQGVDRLPMMWACAAGGIHTPEELAHVMRHGSRETAQQRALKTIEELTGQSYSTSPTTTPTQPAPSIAPTVSAWERLTREQQAFGVKLGKKTPEAKEAFAREFLQGASLGLEASPAAGTPPTDPGQRSGAQAQKTPPHAASGRLWDRLTPQQQSLAQKMGKMTPASREEFAREYLEATGQAM
jgi:hypothetical protein